MSRPATSPERQRLGLWGLITPVVFFGLPLAQFVLVLLGHAQFATVDAPYIAIAILLISCALQSASAKGSAADARGAAFIGATLLLLFWYIPKGPAEPALKIATVDFCALAGTMMLVGGMRQLFRR